MGHHRCEKAAELETQIKIALQGLVDCMYMSTNYAIKALDVSKATFIHYI